MDAQPPTNKRRNRILFIGAALLVLIGFEASARFLGPNTSQIFLNLDSHRENLETTDPGWLFVGDSSFGAAVDPAVFEAETGQSGYNLWQPTASMQVVERLVFDYGLRRSDPSVVAIGVTGRMFNGATSDEVLAKQVELESSLPWERVADPSVATDVEGFFADYSALVRHRSALRRPSDWFRAATADQPVDTDERGHLTFDESLSVVEIRPAHRDAEREALAGYVPGDLELDALTNTIRRLDDLGMTVYVVVVPVYDEVYSTYYPNGEADVASFRSRLLAQLDGSAAVLIDMADFGQEPSMFSDENHLRPEAAEQFSLELGRRVSGSGAPRQCDGKPCRRRRGSASSVPCRARFRLR